MWSVRANFVHNDDPNRTNATFYDEMFSTQKEAEEWLDENYDLLAGACSIDCENEDDLQGFYLDEIVTYEEVNA